MRGASIVVMVALGTGVLFLLGGRALAHSHVRSWKVPPSQRAWREDQLAGIYHLNGVLALSALFLYGLSSL